MQINPVTVVGMVAESGVQKGGWLIQAAASSVLGRQVRLGNTLAAPRSRLGHDMSGAQVIELCKHEGIKVSKLGCAACCCAAEPC